MKINKELKAAFGLDQSGFINLPPKVSNVKVSRYLNYRKMGGCHFCFPHGFTSTNSRWGKIQRSWKKHRKHQWKAK